MDKFYVGVIASGVAIIFLLIIVGWTTTVVNDDWVSDCIKFGSHRLGGASYQCSRESQNG